MFGIPIETLRWTGIAVFLCVLSFVVIYGSLIVRRNRRKQLENAELSGYIRGLDESTARLKKLIDPKGE